MDFQTAKNIGESFLQTYYSPGAVRFYLLTVI